DRGPMGSLHRGEPNRHHIGSGGALRIRSIQHHAVVGSGRLEAGIRLTMAARAIPTLLGVAMVAAACTGSATPPPSPPAFQTGGTLRVSWRQSDNVLGPVSRSFLLDPQVAYNTTGWEILRCCLARTLLS